MANSEREVVSKDLYRVQPMNVEFKKYNSKEDKFRVKKNAISFFLIA